MVVPADPFDDGELQLRAGAPDAVADQLGLEAVDEALGHRVVISEQKRFGCNEQSKCDGLVRNEPSRRGSPLARTTQLPLRAKRGSATDPASAAGYEKLGTMSNLAARTQQLVDAAPISKVRTGVRTVLELTAYPDGHANLAVGEVDTSQRGAMRYMRADSLPLNHRAELELLLGAILDRLFEKSASED